LQGGGFQFLAGRFPCKNNMKNFVLELPAETEQEIQNKILQYLSLKNIVAWRNNTGAMTKQNKKTHKIYFVRFGVKGQSDITGILPDGRRLEIEVKKPGYLKHLSKKKRWHLEEQQTYQDMINKNNGLAFCALCVEDVDAGLAGKGKEIYRASWDI